LLLEFPKTQKVFKEPSFRLFSRKLFNSRRVK